MHSILVPLCIFAFIADLHLQNRNHADFSLSTLDLKNRDITNSFVSGKKYLKQLFSGFSRLRSLYSLLY